MTVRRRLRSLTTQSALHVCDIWNLAGERRRFAKMPESLRERVSVPIATYDRIDVLVKRTIPALLNQTYADIEIIIVGDGTPRDLFSRLDAIDDPRVRKIRLEERTRYPQDSIERWMVAGWLPRNIGAAHATGGWLLWMSDDDIILPRGIEILIDLSRNRPSADVVSAGFVVNTNPQRLDLPSTAETGLPLPIAGMPALMTRVYTRAFRWSGKSHLKKTDRPSDYDLIHRMHRAGMSFAATDQVVAVVPEVLGTGQIGSRAFAVEEGWRKAGWRGLA